MLEVEMMVMLGAASGIATLLFVAGLCVVQLRKTQLRLSHLERELVDYKQQLKTINQGAVGVGRHLSALEKRLLTGLNKVEKQNLKEVNMLSFGDASRLVEQGVDADVLVKRCGMSRAEAELLCKLRQTA